ncbi:alveolar macrophage chemotactic factor-like [Acridotheres tristis]
MWDVRPLQKLGWSFSVSSGSISESILEANGNLSCRCLKSTRAFIPPAKYSSIEVWPVGSSCRRPEVVIKLKSRKRVCVDPDTLWVKKLLQDLPHLRKKKTPR